MGDIKLVIKDRCFALNLQNGDLEADDGLETAVSISLFTDKRVSNDELPSGQTSKRGWFGDLFGSVDQDKIGSKLWLLERSKRTNETLRKFEDYSREALQWLIEDGVCDSIEIAASYDSNKHLSCEINISRPKNKSSRFQVLWDKQELKVGN
jgi:phage gp46-like protein